MYKLMRCGMNADRNKRTIRKLGSTRNFVTCNTKTKDKLSAYMGTKVLTVWGKVRYCDLVCDNELFVFVSRFKLD